MTNRRCVVMLNFVLLPIDIFRLFFLFLFFFFKMSLPLLSTFQLRTNSFIRSTSKVNVRFYFQFRSFILKRAHSTLENTLISFVFFPILSHDRYNISWTVDSHTPIEEFKLYFRRLPQGHEIDNSIDQQPVQHHSSQSHRNYGNLMHWSRNDWRDVVLPAVPLSHHYTQGMSYMIRGLDPDQQYEARVQAR